MSEKRAETTFIMVHETTLQSWARDASTFALFVSLIGVGIMLDSSAMQWMGAIIAFIVILSKANGKMKRMTRDEAMAFLSSLPSTPNQAEAGKP